LKGLSKNLEKTQCNCWDLRDFESEDVGRRLWRGGIGKKLNDGRLIDNCSPLLILIERRKEISEARTEDK